MDERTSSILQQFKRRGAWYIFVPALSVALVVVLGLGEMLVSGYGLTMASGLNGVVAGSIGGSKVTDAGAAAELDSDLESLRNLGSFSAVRVIDTRGELIGCAGACANEPVTIGGAERTALVRKVVVTRVVRHHDEWVLRVVGPLTRFGDGPPYGVVVAERPFSLVAPSLMAVLIAFSVVVLLGASVAYGLLRYLIYQAEQEIDRGERVVAALGRRLNASTGELEMHSRGTLLSLVSAVDARDSYTARHSLNVADYAVAIVKRMGCDDFVPLVEQAGLLHDVGKIGISESILWKPAALTDDEYDAVKQHPVAGAKIIETVPSLSAIIPAVVHHHERWDGTGYPDGLAGEDIPLEARVLAVADAFDAMTSERPYHAGMSLAQARRELVRCRGAQFDPAVVDVFVEALDGHEIRLRRVLSAVPA
jgi:putative nucleotidyltransferase with HDIG domain